MALWGDKKWSGFKWGHSVPATSDVALLRAIVAGATSWLPPPATGAPNGGDPTTGTALYRHADTHIYLMDSEDWTDRAEFVGIITGSRTSQLQGPVQQDTLQFTLYDPTDYYTDGDGALLLWDGNLVRVAMEISSPGGTMVSPLGVYRLTGFPQVTRSRTGTQLTVNAVEWFRDLLSGDYRVPTCSSPLPSFVQTNIGVSNIAILGAWPTAYNELLAGLYGGVVCSSDFQAWAYEQFTNQRTHDFDDGEGVQQVWMYAPFQAAAFVFWVMLGGGDFAHDRLVVDRNLKDPFGGFFLNGSQVGATSTISTGVSPKAPEWRDILAQLVSLIPYMAVMDGNGKIHLRNPGGRYVSPFVVSCEPTTGGTLPLPVESVDHTTSQPEFTETFRYRQINPQSGGDGTVVNQAYFQLLSRSKAPSRFSAFPRREIVIADTITPDPAPSAPTGTEIAQRTALESQIATLAGSTDPDSIAQRTALESQLSTSVASVSAVVVELTVPVMPTEDGSSIPRMLEIMQAADTVTLTMDSAFPYIKLGDEIKIAMPGCRGFYTVTSITQPFDTGSMSIQLTWRDDN